MSSHSSSADVQGAGLPRVLLLFDAAGDRRVLSSWLGDDHHVIAPDPEKGLEQDFDICVLDDANYARLWMRLEERKRASEPVFLPFVLITSHGTGHLVSEVPKHDVDEVLEAPVQRDVLVKRVDVLVDRRRHELRLEAEREQALEALQESEAKARDLIRYAPTGIYEIDFETQRFTSVNDAMIALSGYSRDELLSMNALDILDEPSREKFRERIAKTLAGEKLGQEVEYRVRKKDGTCIYVVLQVRFKTDDAGNPTGAFVIGHDVTERRRAADALREAQERQSFLLRFSDLLRTRPDERSIKDSAVEMLAEYLSVDRCWISEVYLDKGYSTVGPEHIRSDLPPMTGVFQLSDYPETMRQLSTQPMDVADATCDPRFSESEKSLLAQLHLRALLVVPLYRGPGHVIWTLCVAMATPRRWTQGERLLLEDVAERTWAAVERARVESALRESENEARTRAQRMAVLKQIAEIGTSALDVRAVAQAFADALPALLGAHRVAVELDDPSRTHLRIVASYGYPEDLLAKVTPVPGESGSMLAYRTREPVYVGDYMTEELSESRRSIAAQGGTGSSSLQPLLIAGRPIGVVALSWPEPKVFDPEEQSFLRAAAAQMAVGLENARLFEAQETRRGRIEALHDVLQAGVTSLDVRDSAQRIVDHLSRQGDFDLASIWLARGDHLALMAQVGYPPEFDRPVYLSQHVDSVEVFKSGRAIVVTEPRNSEILAVYGRMGIDLSAYAVFPLKARDRTIGILATAWTEPIELDEYDPAFFDSVADQIAVVLQNADFYGREHDIADRLQEALLALPDAVPGVEFAHAYHSATEAARVGGDFYDIFEINEGRVGVVIGDVAGKGIDAAVLTSMVKNTVRAHANERGKTPARILKLTNDVVYKSTPTESFVTLFLGILDCRDGRLAYGNAGHTTAAVAGSDGNVSKLSVTGPLLGAFNDVEFEEAETKLGLDALLFLYTDGLTEARRDGELYGEQRVFARLSATCDGPPADVVREMIDDVLRFGGGRLRDDLAILALKRVEQGTEAPHQRKLEM